MAWLHSMLSLNSPSRPYVRRKFMVVAASQSYWCLVGSWVPQELRVEAPALAACGARRGASFAWQGVSKGCCRDKEAWQRQS